MERVLLNAVPILNVSMEEALAMIERAVKDGERRSIYFVNADCMNITARDPDYHRTLARSDAWIFADGAGIRIAGAIRGQPIKDNVNGTDIFPLLCGQCAKNQQTMFLLGGRPGVAEAVRVRMTLLRPGLRVVGTQHGYFSHEDCDDVIQKINASGAEIVLVGFGAPLQERFIARHRERLTAPVVMGVGGLFDFYSGRVPRAPKIVREASLEWAWRLAMEPRRLWRRYLIGNFTFLGRVMWWEIRERSER